MKLIRVGCSGWSYPEWSGIFYPRGTGNLFSSYSSFFNTVEINSTFYNFPSDRTVENWIRQAHNREFLYSVKIPSTVTHDLILRNRSECRRVMRDFEERVTGKLKIAGKLAAALIQLSPFTNEKNVSDVYDLIEALDTSSLTYAVEPRHSSLYSNSSFYEQIRRLGAVPVSIDSPEKPLENIFISMGRAYVRLHGRNLEDWNSHAGKSMARYNYRYSGEEILGLAKMIVPLKDKGGIFVYFNNHPNGNVPMNAAELVEKLENSGKRIQKSLF